MSKRDDRLTKGSMGCYLCPPNHPSYFYEVETDLNREKDNRGSMNIEYSLTQEYTSSQTKEEVEKLLSDYTPPKIGSKSFNEWEKKVMAHFKNLESEGIEFIKGYYPNYNE